MSRIEDELNKLVVENPEYLRTLITKLDIYNRIKPQNPDKEHRYMISYGTTCNKCYQTYWFPQHTSCPNHPKDDDSFKPSPMFGGFN